ncbi:expressed unknown protein [Seminavis robusta]|uniref:Uncharacterized protein n=1 Tax=Seminavis robusta TaxID=568900 RepID=A0A9N8DRM7_9STRA|nr:expressed unknown protein [Seminavis robusta]|eukprot:Sro239_g095930.1 n/a (408) ;mRNA; f:49147-50370
MFSTSNFSSTNPMVPYLDVVLGGSIRAILIALKGYNKPPQRKDTIRVFSRSFDAPRRMKEVEVIHVFEMIGSCSNLMRLELCSPFCDRRQRLKLPAAAIARCLLASSSGCLEDLLLKRVQVSGEWSDMRDLTFAMLNHQSMKRLYITDSHPTQGSANLVPFLRAAVTNPRLESVALSDVSWAGQALCPLDHESSTLTSIRVRGAQCLGPIEWIQFVDNLRFNGALKELRITACALCPGFGATIARVLAVHPVLEEVILEFKDMEDTVPICWALATNTVLTRLDLLVYSPGADVKQRLITSMFADTMKQNYTLHHLSLRSATSWLSCPRLDFYLRLNRCADRANLLQRQTQMTAKEWVDMLFKNRHDLSVLYYLLMLNPSLCLETESGASKKKLPPMAGRSRKRKRLG